MVSGWNVIMVSTTTPAIDGQSRAKWLKIGSTPKDDINLRNSLVFSVLVDAIYVFPKKG